MTPLRTKSKLLIAFKDLHNLSAFCLDEGPTPILYETAGYPGTHQAVPHFPAFVHATASTEKALCQVGANQEKPPSKHTGTV